MPLNDSLERIIVRFIYIHHIVLVNFANIYNFPDPISSIEINRDFL